MPSNPPADNDFAIRHGQTLACLGDSITEAPDGYVAIAANLIAAVYPERDIRVINCGISGNKAPDMRARLERDVIAHNPDWVTVNVGINDVWHGFFDSLRGVPIQAGGGPEGVSLDVYEPTLADIVRSLQTQTRARILLLEPTIIGEDPDTPENHMLNAYVEAMRRVASAQSVPVCPMRAAFFDALARGRAADPTYSLTTDGVHPNAVGHHLMAVTLLRSLGFFAALAPAYGA